MQTYVNLWSQIYTNLRAKNWVLYKQIKSFNLLTRGFLFHRATNLLCWGQPLPFVSVKDGFNDDPKEHALFWPQTLKCMVCWFKYQIPLGLHDACCRKARTSLDNSCVSVFFFVIYLEKNIAARFEYLNLYCLSCDTSLYDFTWAVVYAAK